MAKVHKQCTDTTGYLHLSVKDKSDNYTHVFLATITSELFRDCLFSCFPSIFCTMVNPYLSHNTELCIKLRANRVVVHRQQCKPMLSVFYTVVSHVTEIQLQSDVRKTTYAFREHALVKTFVCILPVMWVICSSGHFTVSNGVGQGVLSLCKSFVYLDEIAYQAISPL